MLHAVLKPKDEQYILSIYIYYKPKTNIYVLKNEEGLYGSMSWFDLFYGICSAETNQR